MLVLYHYVLLVTTMFLPHRLLALELERSSCWKQYLHYQKTLIKVENNSLQIKFLENCKRADLIPRFLKFRIPNNGCFDEKTVHNFQKQLLKKELCRAKEDLKKTQSHLEEKRDALRNTAPDKCIPSIILHTRRMRRKARQEQSRTHAKKLVKFV